MNRADLDPRLVALPSGRLVLDTGKVQIGLRVGDESRAARRLDWSAPLASTMSRDAERLQAALLAERSTPAPGRPADWIDDEELAIEMARLDAEALEWVAVRLRRLAWCVIALAALAVAWWAL